MSAAPSFIKETVPAVAGYWMCPVKDCAYTCPLSEEPNCPTHGAIFTPEQRIVLSGEFCTAHLQQILDTLRKHGKVAIMAEPEYLQSIDLIALGAKLSKAKDSA